MIELSYPTFLLCAGIACGVGQLAAFALARFFRSPTPPAVKEAIAADLAVRHQLRAILTDYKQLIEERHLFENDAALLQLSLTNLQAFLEAIGEPAGFVWAASHRHEHHAEGR